MIHTNKLFSFLVYGFLIFILCIGDVSKSFAQRDTEFPKKEILLVKVKSNKIIICYNNKNVEVVPLKKISRKERKNNPNAIYSDEKKICKMLNLIK